MPIQGMQGGKLSVSLGSCELCKAKRADEGRLFRLGGESWVAVCFPCLCRSVAFGEPTAAREVQPNDEAALDDEFEVWLRKDLT